MNHQKTLDRNLWWFLVIHKASIRAKVMGTKDGQDAVFFSALWR
jgi:hypothetical protein